jgi:hypothetical protein
MITRIITKMASFFVIEGGRSLIHFSAGVKICREIERRQFYCLGIRPVSGFVFWMATGGYRYRLQIDQGRSFALALSDNLLSINADIDIGPQCGIFNKKSEFHRRLK